MNSAPVLAEVRLLLVDLDGTLHADRRLLDGLDEAFLDYVARKCGFTVARVSRELEKFRAGAWREVLSSPSEFAFLVHMGCSIDEWLDIASTAVDKVGQISVLPQLQTTLTSIRAFTPIALTTNSPWVLATAVIRRLGLEDSFDLIACPRHPNPSVPFPVLGKPSSSLYASIARHFSVSSKETYVIGDRDKVDLMPAALLGMRFHLARGPREVVEVLRRMTAPAEG